MCPPLLSQRCPAGPTCDFTAAAAGCWLFKHAYLRLLLTDA